MLFKTFILAAFPILTSAAAAAVPSHSKSDCTVSVTPPMVTRSTYTNQDVFYTTSVVTVYVRDSSLTGPASTSTPAQALKRALSHEPTLVPASNYRSSPILLPRQYDTRPLDPGGPSRSSEPHYACSSSAITTTLPASTTTVTKTYTFSHAARATYTAPACSPHNIYNGTVSYNSKQTHFPVRQPRGEDFPQHTSPEACCNQCFDGSCMWYIFDNLDRDGTTWVGGCRVYWSDGGCINGVGKTEALRMENADESGGRGLTGLGPCLVEVGYFTIG